MKTPEKERKRVSDMGFGLIAAGFVFLFNPVYHVIDLLPDFIGFFLIWKGLARLASLEYELEDSRNIIKWLIVTELIKPFTLIFMRGSAAAGLGTPDSLLPMVHDNSKLLFAFVFSVIELILFIPAVKKMFSGLDSLGIRFSSESLNATEDKKIAVREGKKVRFVTGKRDVSRKVYGIILMFYIARVFFTVVCELPALQMYEYTGYVDNRTLDLTRFKNLFYVFSSVVVLILGIVFLYFTLRFFRAVGRDSDFCGKLENAYSGYMGLIPHVREASCMNTSAVFFVIGMIYTVLLFGTSIPVFSGLLFFVFIVTAALFCLRRSHSYPFFAVTVVPAAAYAVLSFFDDHFQRLYYVTETYGEFDTLHFGSAAKIYFPMALIEAIKYVIAGALFIVFVYVYRKTVIGDINRLSVDGEFAGLPTYSSEDYREVLTRSVRIRATVALVLGGANFLIEAAFKYFLFLPDVLSAVLQSSYYLVCVAWLISMTEFFRFTYLEIYSPLSDVESRRRS
ncbi:MAG: hypothetical protein II736_06475 [Clostridia bacterium]|nr:hypothetical protein [Clostridia bacterium]